MKIETGDTTNMHLLVSDLEDALIRLDASVNAADTIVDLSESEDYRPALKRLISEMVCASVQANGLCEKIHDLSKTDQPIDSNLTSHTRDIASDLVERADDTINLIEAITTITACLDPERHISAITDLVIEADQSAIVSRQHISKLFEILKIGPGHSLITPPQP